MPPKTARAGSGAARPRPARTVPRASRGPGERTAVVGPLDRGLAVLRALSVPGEHRQRPSDLVHTTGLARSTVDRVVGTLIRIGYLREEGREVEPAPRLMELGNAYLASSAIPGVLGPYAAELADELDESVALAVPDGTGVRFVAQHTRPRAMSLAFRIGDLLPAERCAAGLALAAGWDEARFEEWRARRRADPDDTGFPAVPPRREAAAPDRVEAAFRRGAADAAARGWACEDGLVEPGVVALAVPVADACGQAVCAVGVVSHTSRHSLASLVDTALPRLRERAAAMHRALAGQSGRGGWSQDSVPTAGDGGGAGRAARAAKNELGAGFLQSLARGLAVLHSLGGRPGGLTLSQAAEATGLPRATARRALHSLVQLGYAATDKEGRRFRLLPRVLELGYATLSRLELTDIVQPSLRRLAEEVGESASLAVLDGPDIRYAARVPAHRIMRVTIGVGTRFPAYATSMGRVLLAGLPEGEREALLDRSPARAHTAHTVTDRRELARVLDAVARDGHALVDQELEEGLRSLAMPVRDAAGRVVAAVNVPTHAGTGPPEETRARLLPALSAAQARIEEDLRVVGGAPR